MSTPGCEVTFYAVVDSFAWSALRLGYHTVHLRVTGLEDGRWFLYSAFSAASVLLSRILKDTEEFINNLPPPIPDHARHFPCVSDLPTCKDEARGTPNFEIVEHL